MNVAQEATPMFQCNGNVEKQCLFPWTIKGLQDR